MHFTSLYCTLLSCTAVQCIVLSSAVLCCTAVHILYVSLCLRACLSAITQPVTRSLILSLLAYLLPTLSVSPYPTFCYQSHCRSLRTLLISKHWSLIHPHYIAQHNTTQHRTAYRNTTQQHSISELCIDCSPWDSLFAESTCVCVGFRNASLLSGCLAGALHPSPLPACGVIIEGREREGDMRMRGLLGSERA